MEGLSIAIGRSGDIAKFWTVIGPLIASRAVYEALHEPIFDSADTVWFVAQGEDGSVQGFCAALIGATSAKLLYDWAIDGKDGDSVASKLCEARHKYLSHDHAALAQSMTTHSKLIIDQLKDYGFKLSHRKGKFSVLHSTVVRQSKEPRPVKEKKVRAVKAKAASKTFRPVPKPSKRKA